MGWLKKARKWNDQQAVQSWLPLLSGLFRYDRNGTIYGLSTQYYQKDPQKSLDQLKAIPLLLKKKSGVSTKTIKTIKNIVDSIPSTGLVTEGNFPFVENNDVMQQDGQKQENSLLHMQSNASSSTFRANHFLTNI